MKNAIMQVTYFLNGPMFFLSILFYIERKWLLVRNLAIILPLKSKLSEKFQRFNAIDKSIEIEMLFPHPTPSPHQVKFYYVSETKIFLRRYLQIYGHLLSKCFKNAVLHRQEMVHAISFLTPSRNVIALKFVKSEIFLVVLWEHIIFNVKWVDVHKMSDAFWAKLYCKICDLFC